MFRRLLTLILAAIGGLSAAGAARAHPHVFITYAIAVIFDDNDIAGLRVTWTFDEMYSSMIRTDYTASKTGAVTPADVKTIEKEAFSNLANYGYFVEIKVNGEPIRLKNFKDFNAKFADNRAIYQFTLPLETPDKQPSNTIEIGVFDPEYYIEFTLREKDPLALDHAGRFATDCTVLRNERRMTVLGPIMSDLAVCTYARKS